MLYLAEIQKQKTGFISSGRTDLKLLACQRTEQHWSAIPGDELIPAPDEANNYPTGIMVLIDLNSNRQLQGPLREAGRNLVNILQNLSRQIEKYKKEADEIESWRQSLSLQSQQLQLRQEEIYSKEEELEQTRAELDRLTQESQELEVTLRNTEKQRQELTIAWERLREQQQILEQQNSQGKGISSAQVEEIKDLLNYISGVVPPYEMLQQELQTAQTVLSSQQEFINQHRERLRQKNVRAQESEVDLQKQGDCYHVINLMLRNEIFGSNGD